MNYSRQWILIGQSFFNFDLNHNLFLTSQIRKLYYFTFYPRIFHESVCSLFSCQNQTTLREFGDKDARITKEQEDKGNVGVSTSCAFLKSISKIVMEGPIILYYFSFVSSFHQLITIRCKNQLNHCSTKLARKIPKQIL